MKKRVSRGEIWWCSLPKTDKAGVQAGSRPVLVIQNNLGNQHSPTVIVAVLTSEVKKLTLPTHVLIKNENYKLLDDSLVLCEQLKTVNKRQLKNKLTKLNDVDLARVNQALKISIGLPVLDSDKYYAKEEGARNDFHKLPKATRKNTKNRRC